VFNVSAANRGQPCLGRRRAKQRNPRDVVSGIGRKTFLLILKDFCRCLTDFSQLYLLHWAFRQASSGDTILGSSSSSSSLAGTNTIEHTLLVPMDDDMVRER